MKIFLLVYEPATGRLLQFKLYDEASRGLAQADRLRIEKNNAQAGLTREVVVLEAVNEEALRATHGRYFKSASELAALGGAS
jgi:hypothetical protein